VECRGLATTQPLRQSSSFQMKEDSESMGAV
jgi:hypothetical protein